MTTRHDARDRLRHVGPLDTTIVRIPETSLAIRVVHPRDIDTLLDLAMDDPEQNLPYWSQIWPSGIALAAELCREPALVSGRPTIELGCGLGITAAIAVRLGARLTATDYAAESLDLTRVNCEGSTGKAPDLRRVNWRDPGAHLLQPDGSRWPLVLAADVLYEERDIDPMLETLSRIVSPDGLVILAEPGRRPARIAIERAGQRGWRNSTREWTAEWPDPDDAGTVVRVHRMWPPRDPNS